MKTEGRHKNKPWKGLPCLTGIFQYLGNISLDYWAYLDHLSFIKKIATYIKKKKNEEKLSYDKLILNF